MGGRLYYRPGVNLSPQARVVPLHHIDFVVDGWGGIEERAAIINHFAPRLPLHLLVRLLFALGFLGSGIAPLRGAMPLCGHRTT